MTTSNSPIHKLREQAERIANRLKALERGENIPGLMPLRKLEKIKIGLVQDDKITQVEFTWERIKETDEEALIEYILMILKGEIQKPN
jgi:hypothetical protein